MSGKPGQVERGLIRPEYVTQTDLDELKTAISEYRRFSWGNLLWLLGFVLILFFTTLLLIPAVQIVMASWLGVEMDMTTPANAPAGATNAASQIFPQFMTLFLAVAAGGIAYMASMMGMRRLQNYDDQFQRFRSEQREFTKDIVEQIDRKQEALREELITITDRTSGEAVSSIKVEVERTVRSGQDELTGSLAKSMERIGETTQQLNTRFGFLADNSLAREALNDAPSASDAHKKITLLFSEQKAKEARELVTAVLANRLQDREALRSTGDPNDWFNLGSHLGQNNEFSLGLKVNFAGLLQEGSIRLK